MRTRPQDQGALSNKLPLHEWLIDGALGGLAAAWVLSLTHLEPGHLGWVVLRVTGFVSYGALALTSVLGPLISSRYAPRWFSRAVQYGWHGLLAGLALALSAIHGAFILVGGNSAQPIQALLVPGMSAARPLAGALGTMATYFLILVFFSFKYRVRLGVRLAQRLHFLSYPAFIAASWHGWLAGSDFAVPLYAVSALGVSFTTALRVLEAIRSVSSSVARGVPHKPE